MSNTAGEFEGGGEASPQGFSEAPKGELDSPLEVSRLSKVSRLGIYETGH